MHVSYLRRYWYIQLLTASTVLAVKLGVDLLLFGPLGAPQQHIVIPSKTSASTTRSAYMGLVVRNACMHTPFTPSHC
jgi:hypothetical protein